MEQVLNIPIQMISCCSTVGDMQPLRFRFENEEHELITIQVDKVLAHNDTVFNGIKEIHYVCQTTVDDRIFLFILKYNISSHKWIMFKRLT